MPLSSCNIYPAHCTRASLISNINVPDHPKFTRLHLADHFSVAVYHHLSLPVHTQISCLRGTAVQIVRRGCTKLSRTSELHKSIGSLSDTKHVILSNITRLNTQCTALKISHATFSKERVNNVLVQSDERREKHLTFTFLRLRDSSVHKF